ncbi:PilX N-terminal [Acetoanaerobium noterae]|uniref:PilX N-terminal n=1 Tax=Acetoanaerobium noterae TaxID=745369 RepID=A0A1T5ASY9_9FIRM|nr:pilus assembly PilX N-terminal domain-containing protein [Acetoanaerobium noterae]SKB37713.1 PilX N-terminal [Acetoanaerobium noterae]
MKKLNLKKRKGGALVFTLLVMLIMTILGTTLLQISLAENKMAIRDKNRIEAYYLARAGVETTAAYLIDNATPEADINQIVDKKSDEISYGKGTFNVELIKDPTAGSHSIIVKGTGTVNGVSENATLEVNIQGVPGGPAFEYGLFAMGNIYLSGSANIAGDTGSNGSIGQSNGQNRFNGDTDSNLNKQYPPPVFPTDPDTASNQSYGNNSNVSYNMSVNKIRTYNELSAGQNTELTINTGSNNPAKPAVLVVGTLNFPKSEIIVNGTNPLYIYVKKEATLSVVNSPGSSNKLFLFMADGASLQFGQGNNSFEGFIYGPGATLNINGGENISGGVIIKTFSVNGNFQLTDETSSVGGIDLGDLPVQIYKTVNWLD